MNVIDGIDMNFHIKRKIDKIAIHHSGSRFGCALLIDQWHKERGWEGIGYHFVIGNGLPYPGSSYLPELDGMIEIGRNLEEIGAHVKGHNENTIGICLIGDEHFSMSQLNHLSKLLRRLMSWCDLSADDIMGHNEFEGANTLCPMINMNTIRKALMDTPNV